MQIWCDNNGMVLNARKCKVMDITRARRPLFFEYSINGAALEYVHRQRLLGVHLSSDLRWEVHTDTVRAKAAQTLSFAARNLQGCTPRVKRMAYQSLVKPIMTFGLPAWHPTTAENTNKLEGLQKRALHFIHGRQLPPVNEQVVMPMAMHLQYTDLVFFKRCTSGATDFDARRASFRAECCAATMTRTHGSSRHTRGAKLGGAPSRTEWSTLGTICHRPSKTVMLNTSRPLQRAPVVKIVISDKEQRTKSTQVHCGGWGLFDLGSFSKIFARGGAVSSNNTLFQIMSFNN